MFLLVDGILLMMFDKNELSYKFAARALSENWLDVLRLAETIRSRAAQVPQVKNAQAVEEYLKAHTPQAEWESACEYVDAVMEEWRVAAGGLTLREKMIQARASFQRLMDGDQTALLSGGVERNDLERANHEVQAAQAMVASAKDHRERAEAESRLKKANERLKQAQDKHTKQRLAALMVILGRGYSLEEEYNAIMAAVEKETPRSNDKAEDDKTEQSETPAQGQDVGSHEVAARESAEVPKVSKSPLLPKFLKKQ